MVSDLDSRPFMTSAGRGPRGTSGSLSCERSNSSVYVPTGSASNVAVEGPVILADHSRPAASRAITLALARLISSETNPE